MAGEAENPIFTDKRLLAELNEFNYQLLLVDVEQVAKKHLAKLPILAARENTIARIPSFWAAVFDHAYEMGQLEATLIPDDLTVFAKALKKVTVTRPEIPSSARVSDVGIDKFGEPRTIRVRFDFDPAENEHFTDAVLEKTFWYRQSTDGSASLVSDPIKINWKPGKDLTGGLTDGAYALWQAQKSRASQQLDSVLDKEARKARDDDARLMPEYLALAKLVKEREEHVSSASLFNLFSYRGRWVSAAEGAQAKATAEAKRRAGEESDDEDEDDDEEETFAEEQVETFPPGEDVAIALADDIWPDAIDLYLQDPDDLALDLGEDDDSDDESDGDVEMS